MDFVPVAKELAAFKMRISTASNVLRCARTLVLAGLVASTWIGQGFAMSDRNASAAYFQDAKDYIAQGRTDDAIVQLKNALQADPNNVEARLKLADLYIETNNGVSAEKEARAAIDRGDLKGTAQDKLADAYLLQGKYQALLDEITPESASEDVRAEVLRARGEAYHVLGDEDNAIASYEAAEQREPNAAGPKVGLVRVYIRQHNFAKAEELADFAMAGDPSSFDAVIAKGQVLQAKGDLDGAVAKYDDALKSKPDDTTGLMARAIALVDLKRYDDALQNVLTVRKLDPHHPVAAYLNAMILARQGNFSGARDILLQSDALLHNYPPAVFLSGAVAYAQGSYEQASANLKRYLESNPGSLPASRLLGAALLRTGDPDSAVAVLEPIEPKLPGDERIHAILGSAYLAKKQYGAAVEQFEKAVKADPENATLRTKLVVSKLAVGDDQGALQVLGPALASDPGAVRAARLLAENELAAGRYDAVLGVGQQLRDRYPDNPLGEAIIAAAYWGKHDFKNTRAHYAKALKIDPGYEAATLSLARLDVAERDFPAARDRYQKLLDDKPNNVAALMGLYWLAYRDNDKDQAERLLSRALETNPTAAAPQLELIRRDAAAGELDRALFEANALVRLHPQNVAALEILTEIQLRLRDPISASATATQLVDVAPSSARSYLLMARAQSALANTDDARATLKRGMTIARYDASLTSELVKLELRLGHPSAALDAAEDFHQHQPDAVADKLVGDAQMAVGDIDQAIDAYKTGYVKAPSAELALRLKDAYDRKGDAAAGVDILKTWLDKNPSDFNTAVILGSAQLAMGKLNAAAKTFEALYSEDRTNSIVLNNLAWIYHEKGDSRALGMANKAYAADKNSPQILDTLGWISLAVANPQDGLDYLRMASALAPRSTQIRYHLAVALTKTGRTGEARGVLDDLLTGHSSFPELADARKLLATLR